MMAKNSDKIVNSNMATMGLIVVALLALIGIVYYAWSTKPADGNTKTTTETTATSDSANAANVDKLGAREVKLTPENFTEVTTKNKLVLVDMYSPTCIHCQKIAPILTELSNEYGDKLVIAKMSVAIDANREFILNWDKAFQYVPAVSIFKDGQKVDGFTGEKTKAEFKTLIDKYLS
jgi:thioredoxin 1